MLDRPKTTARQAVAQILINEAVTATRAEINRAYRQIDACPSLAFDDKTLTFEKFAGQVASILLGAVPATHRDAWLAHLATSLPRVRVCHD